MQALLVCFQCIVYLYYNAVMVVVCMLQLLPLFKTYLILDRPTAVRLVVATRLHTPVIRYIVFSTRSLKETFR